MGLFIRILKGQKNMWSEKQRKYQKNICSKLMLAILLLASVITLTACRSSNIKETTKQTDHKTKKWEPLVITKREKAQAQKEVKQISDICQNIKINENKVTKKDLQTLYDTLTSKGYPVAQIGEEKHSTKNAPVKFKPSKTSHGEKLKTFYEKTKAGKPTTITLLQQNCFYTRKESDTARWKDSKICSSCLPCADCWTVFFLLYWRGTYIWSERWNHYRFRKFYRNPNVMFDRTK